MFNLILLANDLSKASNCLIDCADGFKKIGVRKIFITCALGIRHIDDLKYLLKEEAEPYLFDQKKKFEQKGFEVLVEIASGIPSEEINRVADQKEVDLVVIGTHGESMAHHVVFKFDGMLSEVLHSFTRPLLLAHTKIVQKNVEKCASESCTDFTRKVLYCTDFSDTAQRAFDYVEKLVESGCKSVTIMHVQDKVKIDKHLLYKLDEFNKIDAERIEMLKERLTRKGAQNIQSKLPYGIPTAEILNEVKKEDYSLIVMGSQGRGYMREIFLGSVSHNITRNAEISVLLIPSIR